MQDAERSPSRSRFWLGFALAFGLLWLASCTSLFIATGLDEVSLAELQGGGPAWTPPPITPTATVPAAAADVEAGAVATPLFPPGSTVRNMTSSRVNVRATAGYLAKPAADIIGQLTPGTVVEIVGPATVADGLNWWLVRYPQSDGPMVEGWVAEATASGVTILGQ